MGKVYYTEGIQFPPARGWVVLGTEREIVSMHTTKGEAEKALIALQSEYPHLEVTMTKCVVLPNFSIK